ncbi:MAG: DNA adenine methylase [Candidatus Heimdallarchaeota archaeon]|nr:MAG: DNA adenine methylase [Candidatus Heimdallarchaeota archaeon]
MNETNSINEALPTSGHSPMYVMHKFFARKQEDVIREYIQTYSNEGDVVFDPFCGSGVMVAEALRLGRKAVGVDINPVAIFITKNTVKKTSSTERIVDEFKQIELEIKQDIEELYQTTCRKCGKIVSAICFTWKNRDLIDVRYECSHHGRLISPVNDVDLDLLKKIEDGAVSEFFDDRRGCRYWYPTNSLYYSDGTPFLKKERFNAINDMFTQRNLVALAKLLTRINEITDSDLKEAFRFAFSSITHLASTMTPVRPSRPFSSAWVQQSYWYVTNNMESNVWKLFERAVIKRQGLIKAKEDLPKDFEDKQEVKKFDELAKREEYAYMLIQSSINDLEEIPEESIDCVITDPPYGHSIQYGELLYMWGSWLQLMENFDEIARGEIVKNPRQEKDDMEYEQMMRKAFRKIFQLLKPGRYCIVTFHNPSLKYRNILFRSVLLSGFEFEKIVYQPPPRASVKSLLQPIGSQRGDYFFRFRKPKKKKKLSYKPIKMNNVEELIVDITRKIIMDRGKPIHHTDIQNALDPILYEELKKSDLLMTFNPEGVERILQKHIGEVFQLVDLDPIRIGNKTFQPKGWWLIDPHLHEKKKE